MTQVGMVRRPKARADFEAGAIAIGVALRSLSSGVLREQWPPGWSCERCLWGPSLCQPGRRVLAIGRVLGRSGAASCAATSDDRLFAGMIVASANRTICNPNALFTFQSLREGRGARLRRVSSAKKAVR